MSFDGIESKGCLKAYEKAEIFSISWTVCARVQGTAITWDENWLFIMTGKNYEADLGNGESFADQKLRGIFLTQLNKGWGNVIVFTKTVWRKKAKQQYRHKNL